MIRSSIRWSGSLMLWRSVTLTVYLLNCCSVALGASLSNQDIQYLFRVSQGAGSQHPPGLWGGEMDYTGTGQGKDLFQYGYGTSVREVTDHISSINIHSVSYDDFTEETLAILQEAGDSGSSASRFTGVAGSLCEADEGKIRMLFTNPVLTDAENPYLFDNDCGGKCGWGPFAYHRGRVYFIMSAVFGKVPALLMRRIELRELIPCGSSSGEDLIEEPLENFNLLECSRRLALLHSTPYRKPEPHVEVWPAASLTAKDIDGEVTLFLQLFDTSIGEAVIQLVVIKPETNATTSLYSRLIDDRYTNNAHIQGFGSIDYHGGFLCWTATDTLLCATYNNDMDVDVITILSPGEATSHGVCSGNMPTEELKRALTGVAIAETGSSLAVYFGCYAEISGVGGVGLVRITNHGLLKEVLPIKNGNQRVYGGSLFLTQNVGNDCDIHTYPSSTPSGPPKWSTSLTLSTDLGPHPSDFPSTGKGHRLKSSALVISLTCLLMLITTR